MIVNRLFSAMWFPILIRYICIKSVPWTKWSKLCRGIQVHFLQRTLITWITLKFVSYCLVGLISVGSDNACGNPLPKPMMNKIANAFMHHQASMFYLYNVLLIYRHHFLHITHGRHPITHPLGQGLGCLSWMQIWPKFYHCYCCAVCTIISYSTAVYRESIVLK